jgi:low temperature requirement protein LtrA
VSQTQEQESRTPVSLIELFFDLVFVFTITQLTALLVKDLTWHGLAEVIVILALLMWMYDGYAWLTNAVAPNNPVRRTLMVIGMAGFLVISLAIPSAFAGSGWVFGVGYFVVNAVHTGLFTVSGGAGVVRAFRRLGPLNLISATLILVGAFTPVGWRWGLWLAALVVDSAAPYLNPIGEFRLSPGHFVERHGLLIIIALGESVVAIGVGAAGLDIGALLLATAVLGLVVAYLMWWVYFGGSLDTAERALAAIDPRRRALAAIHAFSWAHLPMFLGIVAVAAGTRKAVGHANGHLQLRDAALLGAGLAAFLVGDVVFRLVLRIPSVRYRAIFAVVVLVVIPAAMVSGALGLAVAAVVLYGMLFLEDRDRGLRWGDRRAWTSRTEP